MGRLVWPLALAVTFTLGVVTGGFFRGVPEVQRLQAIVEHQELELDGLRTRLRAKEATGPQGRAMSQAVSLRETDARKAILPAVGPSAGGAGQPGDPPRAAEGPGNEPQKDLGSSRQGVNAPAAAPPGVQAALDRFYRFLNDTNKPGEAARWSRVTADLRSMGAAGVEALMSVLANGATAEERRAAAQLLGALQAAQAAPLLQAILAQDNDVLVRRAAAAALQRLESPDTVPVLQSLLANPGEDRLVRLNAALGLARLGLAEGVAGLTAIFAEANGDGRGREMAFRGLSSLDDERALPFMRQVASSAAEPGYRVRAIRYLAMQGDREALPALQQIMLASSEQPSVRDAARSAYTVIAGR